MSILYEAIHQGACRTPQDLHRYLYETAQSSETSFKPLKATQFLEQYPEIVKCLGVDREMDVCSQAFHVKLHTLEVDADCELSESILGLEDMLENKPPEDETEFNRMYRELNLLYDLQGTPWGRRCDYEWEPKDTP